MIRTLKNLFDALMAPIDQQSPEQQKNVLQMATAVLLVEVMRADPEIHASERAAVIALLQRKFALAEDALVGLVQEAEQTAQNAHDLHSFTSSLNAHFTQAQKILVVEYMWQVAYADAHLDVHENHVISKIAGLLHVTHGEYIGAKMRAKEASGEPANKEHP